MTHSRLVCVMHETTLVYSLLQTAGLWLAGSHVTGKTNDSIKKKNPKKQQQHFFAYLLGFKCLLRPWLFCNIISSTDRWKVFAQIWTTFKPTHALQSSQHIKEPAVDYSDWWLLFWLVPSLGSNKGLLSCMNRIQPPTDCFVLLCLLHRPWSTQGSHLWHW